MFHHSLGILDYVSVAKNISAFLSKEQYINCNSNFTSMAGETTLFPKIGEIAEQADGLTATNEPDDEKVIQEIESLCIRCEEQARIHLLLKFLNGYC